MNNSDQVNVREKIKEIIISIAENDISKDLIDTGENGLRNIGLNSLNMIKVMVEIEKAFDIEIDFDEITPANWYSLEHLSHYVLSLMAVSKKELN
ncbi:MAG: acyl carrier protein [Acidobacteria bacterium]|jgi:acyl carrier protein|nr:acyl carrier protein [Acidobacteriota bacterium]